MHIFLLTFSNLFLIVYSQNVFVNTSRGPVVGYYFDQGNDTSQIYYGQADVFLGIPYVQPPIGQLRFKKPVRLEKFTDTPHNATYYRGNCPQFSSTNEDCLYLSVYSPNVQTTTLYPVMVEIHGGGYIDGSSNLNIPGLVRNFISRGVVVASLEYRLGFLGFFTTFTDEFPPNLGLLDQVEGLKWVNEEIKNFGGNPTQITIFGQSAGAASVSAHRYSPISQNLFQQGIQESGTILTCFDGTAGITNQNFKFAQQACNFTLAQWNSKNYVPLVDCLYNISVTDGLNAENIVFGENTTFSIGPAVCWNAVQDNNFFPGTPQTLYKGAKNKPYIIGTCRDEWVFWANQTSLSTYTKDYAEAHLSSKWAPLTGTQTRYTLELFENLYIDEGTLPNDNLAWFKFLVDLGTSFLFTGPSAIDAELFLWNNNSNVYLYEYTALIGSYISANYHPAGHGCEGGHLSMSGWNTNNTRPIDIEVANWLGESWTNFAKYGRPTLNNTWTPATTSDLVNMEYLNINTLEPQPGVYQFDLNMKNGYRTIDRIQYSRVMPIFDGPLPPNLPDYNNGSNVANFPCPYPWKQSSTNTNKCYRVNVDQQMPAVNASHFCNVFWENGTQTSIRNAFENSDIANLVKTLAQNSTCPYFYIGLVNQNGQWVWTNGDPSTYRNWASGYPNTSPNYNVTVIFQSNGTWINLTPDTPACYLCQFNLPIPLE